MIIRSMRKVLSSVVIATYLMVYAAPIGLCIGTAPVAPLINAEVNKPVLRTIAPVTKATPSVLKLEGDINISKGNPKISLSLRNTDVQQVLRMFADKAGLNIVFHSSVTGTVTLDLVNMPLNDAFKLVLQVTDLTYFVDHNTMVVASAAAAQTLNLSKKEMMSIPVKYGDASVIASFLNKNIFSINKPGLSNAQIAITNPATNEILIFGTDNDFRMAKKIVDKFDIKPTNTTYTVNHTTPKEMADLLCTVLFPQSGGSAGGGGSAPAAPAAAPAAPAPPSAPGAPTGGASPLSLGAGVIACTYNNQTTAGPLSSIGTQSMEITYFDQHGTINVSGGSPQQQELIKEFIAQNDKKQPQAYLEVSIVELNESGTQNFQNTWELWSENFSATFGTDGHTITNPLYPVYFGGDTTDLGSKIVSYSGTPTLKYAIDYLISNDKGRILANPRIMITNGEVSTIDLTSDYVKSVTSQVNSTGLVPIVTRTYTIASDDGIKVDLTPFISPDGYVTLNIKPVYATVKEKIYAPGSAGTDLAATLLQRRNLDLKNVRIKDGETLVIGGMIREEETKSITKVPVLGDVPGVGSFFRNTNTTKSKQELVIMITPKIIKDSEDVVKNSDMTL